MTKPLTYRRVNFGCDPEIFLVQGNKVIGAEKVLPKNGISCSYGKVIIDGVQAEINPAPSACRQSLATNITDCLILLQKQLSSKQATSFKQIVSVSEKEFDSLSEKSKRFGCAPSQNIHTAARSKIKVDPKVYRKRSAGGHIHLGHYDYGTAQALDNPKIMVPILDCVLGNTCVLLDRDPGNIERRKVYGRAGEYRKPGPGRLEYRTLSNFWLTSYQLMSLVMGLARFGVNIVASKRHPEILDLVDLKNIVKAINKNDYDLALANFKKLESVIIGMSAERMEFPLFETNMKFFHTFASKINKHGLKFWFKDDPMKHWVDSNYTEGWEEFSISPWNNPVRTRTIKK